MRTILLPALAALLVMACSRDNPLDPGADNYAGQDAWETVCGQDTMPDYSTMAGLDDDIYIIGGEIQWKVSSDKVWRYNTVQDTWIFTPSMPVQRSECAAVPYNGSLYVFGGYRSTRYTKTPLRSVYKFDPQSNLWSACTSMPCSLYQTIAAVVNDHAYIFSDQPVIYHYDFTADTWDTAGTWTDHRAGAKVVSVEETIYIIAGTAMSRVDAFSTVTGSWTTRAPLAYTRNWEGFVAGEIDGRIYAIGGGAGDSYKEMNVNEEYTPASDTWTTKARFSESLSQPVGCVLNGKIYITGHWPDHIYSYTPY